MLMKECKRSLKIPKGVIKIRKWKTDRQDNGQRKRTKGQTMNYKKIDLINLCNRFITAMYKMYCKLFGENCTIPNC